MICGFILDKYCFYGGCQMCEQFCHPFFLSDSKFSTKSLIQLKRPGFDGGEPAVVKPSPSTTGPGQARWQAQPSGASILTIYFKNAGIGCHLGEIYIGVIGCSDDLLIFAPNRNAASIMLRFCEKFTLNNHIPFSTHEDPGRSKSKAIYVVGPSRGNISNH